MPLELQLDLKQLVLLDSGAHLTLTMSTEVFHMSLFLAILDTTQHRQTHPLNQLAYSVHLDLPVQKWELASIQLV